MNSTAPSSSPAPPLIPLRRIAEIFAVLIVIGLVVGFVPRWIARHKLLAQSGSDSNLIVSVISAVPEKSDLGTPLPANVEAFIQASIHARASGYLKDWFVDIGDHVTNGQVLAEIDTPELDEQLAQAKAQWDQAKASLDLAKITADRWNTLLKTASVSEQDAAEKKSDYILQQANVEAARANLQRLQDLKGFDRVTAPFPGVITARNTDIGQLISAGSGPELFGMAQTDPLRVYVQVPQQYVHDIANGQKAQLNFLEMPERTFEATVAQTSGAVDPTTRTLQVELHVPNPKGNIFAGSYAQVRFSESPDPAALTISDNAIIFQAEGTQVAVVGPDNKVHLRKVKVGRDFGDIIEVLDGLTATDRVVDNPPDSIADGMSVEVVKPGMESTQ
ncbi:MAG TPA: efflux RND transporter periplasmic adaptor subunit [Verrucomicrobiae bacterium]|jgi:RND family efflux transporter MFP subunit|nr:efflux RND transporter periplasmic adaptor subunit [Verrucomicrobiae bacterium]